MVLYVRPFAPVHLVAGMSAVMRRGTVLPFDYSTKTLKGQSPFGRPWFVGMTTVRWLQAVVNAASFISPHSPSRTRRRKAVCVKDYNVLLVTIITFRIGRVLSANQERTCVFGQALMDENIRPGQIPLELAEGYSLNLNSVSTNHRTIYTKFALLTSTHNCAIMDSSLNITTQNPLPSH